MQIQKSGFSSYSVLRSYATQNPLNTAMNLKCSKDVFVKSHSTTEQKHPAFLGSDKSITAADKEYLFESSIKELPAKIQQEIAKTNAYIDMAFPTIPKELETIHYPTKEECLDIIKKRAKLENFDVYIDEIIKNNFDSAIEYRELPDSTDLISVNLNCFDANNPMIKLSDANHNPIYEYAGLGNGFKFTDYINKESFNYVDAEEGGIAGKITGDILIQYGINNKYALILGSNTNVKTCGYYPNGSVVRYCSGEYLKKEEIFSPDGEKIREVYYLDKADKEYHTKYVDVKPTT